MVTSPSVIPLQNPTLLQDHMAHVLVYQSSMLCKDSQAFSSSDHQLYDLEEKPVGSALAVTYPAACLKASQQVGESITLSGTPVMELNSDGSMLALFFPGATTLILYSVAYESGTVTLKHIDQFVNISAFTWSYLPSRYATIEKESIIVHVPALKSI